MAFNSMEKNMPKREDCSDLDDEAYFHHPFAWTATPVYPFSFLRSAWTWLIAGGAIISVTAFVALR